MEHRRGCEATLTIDRWRARPQALHLPPPGSDEDEPTDDSPRRDLSPIAEHTWEPPTPASPIPLPVSSAPASIPQALMPSTPPKTLGPMPTSRSDIAGPNTFAQPPAVHYPLYQGLPSSHGDGPHILSHYSFICSFTDHTCREDDPHRGCRSTDPG